MSSETGLKAAEFVHELGTSEYFQTGFASMDYTAALDYFLGGNAAMYYMGTWNLPFFQNDKLSEEMQDNVGYFLMPTLNEGEPMGTANFVANSAMPIGFASSKFDAETERFATHYRMSRALDGPWLIPENDSFDGRGFYAAKTAGNSSERYVVGWIPTKHQNNDFGYYEWGGNLAVHQLIQCQDGTLNIQMPREIRKSFTAQQPGTAGELSREIEQQLTARHLPFLGSCRAAV